MIEQYKADSIYICNYQGQVLETEVRRDRQLNQGSVCFIWIINAKSLDRVFLSALLLVLSPSIASL